MSCFNEKKKNPIAFVCMFSESTLLHIYHVRFDRNYCYYFPFLYKKTPSSWSKISNYIRKSTSVSDLQSSKNGWQCVFQMTCAKFGIFNPPPLSFFRRTEKKIIKWLPCFKRQNIDVIYCQSQMKTKRICQLFCSQFFLLLLIYEQV